jgi:hypothetical protein
MLLLWRVRVRLSAANETARWFSSQAVLDATTCLLLLSAWSIMLLADATFIKFGVVFPWWVNTISLAVTISAIGYGAYHFLKRFGADSN